MTSPLGAKPPCYRVLIVDDNPAIHSDFRKILSAPQENSSRLDEAEAALFGETPTAAPVTRFEIDSAFQGQEGLEKIEQALREGKPYSLAFIDVRMPPGWDGVETISRIWKVDPTLQVVICTAYSDYSWDDMRARLGESDSAVILKKPFDNIEAVQLAHALTKKWLLAGESSRCLPAMASAGPALASGEDEAFATMFRACPVPVAIRHPDDGCILEANDSFLRVTGYPVGDVVGVSLEQFLCGASPGSGVAERVEIRRPTEPSSGQRQIRCKSGEVHPVLVQSERTLRRGRPIDLVFIQDAAQVTERQRSYAP